MVERSSGRHSCGKGDKMIRITQLKLPINHTKEQLEKKIARTLKCQEGSFTYEIIRQSLDARHKDDKKFAYTIDVMVPKEKQILKKVHSNNIMSTEKKRYHFPKPGSTELIHPPVIVGSGPAGLFCAWYLARAGYRPLVLERGEMASKRKETVDHFWKDGILNPDSNVQFGEGGAGTFSDGKLTTNLHSPLCRDVIDTFVKFGAPEEISYINKPHIGTDNLVKIVANIRKYIENNGGEFMFGAKAVDFEIENNQVKSVIVSRIQESTTIDKIETYTVVLAIGHSSRDMFKKLYEKHVEMEKKNFSVGVRIEHKQQMINESQYGKNPKLKLPPAEYKLAYHGEDRSCYTFCMCPGGTVMASSSEEGTIVTNGMSTFARDGENANSAVLVNITPEDFKGDSPLEGMYFQQELEEKAFKLGGSNYNAPIQRVADFLNDKKSTFIGEVKPTYKPGVTLANLQEILPDFVTKTLKEGLIYFDKKIAGFASADAILTGVETRSSSPVTIKRNEQKMASVQGIYPCGEGAGYAGGIMSAAVDGIKVANAILAQ